jgi:hypothetical protein
VGCGVNATPSIPPTYGVAHAQLLLLPPHAPSHYAPSYAVLVYNASGPPTIPLSLQISSSTPARLVRAFLFVHHSRKNHSYVMGSGIRVSGPSTGINSHFPWNPQILVTRLMRRKPDFDEEPETICFTNSSP